MTKFTDTGEIVTGSNRIPSKESYIYVRTFHGEGMSISSDGMVSVDQEGDNFNVGEFKSIPYSKYQIKETDMRIKTATFSSPEYLDLTLGRFVIRIVSPYHENFTGFILSVEYDEDNQVYNYQCQDWSRNYMQHSNVNMLGHITMRNLLLRFLTRGGTDLRNPTSAQLNEYSPVLSGLRPAEDYAQEKWGSIIKFNPMTEKPLIKIRDKYRIEVIRDVIYGSGAYIDLWFNDYGVLQVEPYQKADFFNTGLHLVKPEAIDRKFKFDTTNIITGALVRESTDTNSGGNTYWNQTLASFFGYFTVSSGDKDLYASLGNKVTTTSTKSTTPSNNNMKNPFNNKDKKIMICADRGDNGFKDGIKKLLKADGWSITDLGIGPDKHSISYDKINSSYAVNLVIANGFCAGSVRECITGWLKGHHEKMGVAFVQMWDTHTWTDPHGMKPYRYGDFTGYSASRAWDDNFSTSDPAIKNVMEYFKKYNVLYCCGPTPAEAYEQFKGGGYLKWKQTH